MKNVIFGIKKTGFLDGNYTFFHVSGHCVLVDCLPVKPEVHQLTGSQSAQIVDLILEDLKDLLLDQIENLLDLNIQIVDLHKE